MDPAISGIFIYGRIINNKTHGKSNVVRLYSGCQGWFHLMANIDS